MFQEGTYARRVLALQGEVNQYPACGDPDKSGMRVPECRQTLSRILAAIPRDELTLARYGKKRWNCGPKSKPCRSQSSHRTRTGCLPPAFGQTVAS